MLKSEFQSAIRYYIGNSSADVTIPMRDSLLAISSVVPLRVVASGSITSSVSTLALSNMLGLTSIAINGEYLEIIDFENIDRWIFLENNSNLACRFETSSVRFTQAVENSTYDITYEASHALPSSDVELTVPSYANNLLVLFGALYYFRSLLFTSITKREEVPDVDPSALNKIIKDISDQIGDEISSIVLI